MAAKENFTFRIDPDIKKFGQQIAKKQHRSFSNFIEYLIMEEIEKDPEFAVVFNSCPPVDGNAVSGGNDKMLEDEFKNFVDKE